jgi:NAD(P)-dependent dehydrogenase (short-subunit alcohol dehydrogenase family)
MELQNRIAIITGGGTGIGKATAALFADEGAKVVITGRRKEPLRATVDEINAKGGSAEFVAADVGDQAQMKRLFDQVCSKHGGIDILFNCAGIFATGKASHEFTDSEWEEMMRINFWGTLYCCKLAIPPMQQRGKGNIINCTSVGGRMAFKNQTPYNVAKAAVEMLSKCMAKEVAGSNIRVNTICPGLTDTDMAQGHVARFGMDALKTACPLGRLGTSRDIAEAALFLASDKSSWITAHSMFVDGGTHAY